MAEKSELSTKQKKAIAALVAARTIGEACQAANFSRSTLKRWLDDPTFTAALSAETSAIIGESARRMISGQAGALDTLTTLMQSAESESVKLQAAVNWLTLGAKMIELLDLEARISALEAARSDT
jgi:hypothetical protein